MQNHDKLMSNSKIRKKKTYITIQQRLKSTMEDSKKGTICRTS